ncbi:uncharacterized protein LOC26535402 isoform X5 [Drosophila yakuba]|uniref:uncharacterized protein LOC26535402 isoform X5 n=1 Tax=Drosophila yakuba TaxID=7245 RepID=UPI0019307C89|nr:uncharacterized protein LOC26535402 isoform X5 [Drosophila yakuba]
MDLRRNGADGAGAGAGTEDGAGAEAEAGVEVDSWPSWRRLRSSQATDCLALIIAGRHMELGVDHKAIHSTKGSASFPKCIAKDHHRHCFFHSVSLTV